MSVTGEVQKFKMREVSVVELDLGEAPVSGPPDGLRQRKLPVWPSE